MQANTILLHPALQPMRQHGDSDAEDDQTWSQEEESDFREQNPRKRDRDRRLRNKICAKNSRARKEFARQTTNQMLDAITKFSERVADTSNSIYRELQGMRRLAEILGVDTSAAEALTACTHHEVAEQRQLIERSFAVLPQRLLHEIGMEVQKLRSPPHDELARLMDRCRMVRAGTLTVRELLEGVADLRTPNSVRERVQMAVATTARSDNAAEAQM